MLDRVTITGADDSVFPHQLLRLSEEFPFVEWGLLFKYRQYGTPQPRWPRIDWLVSLFSALHGQSATPQFALHLCGRTLIRFLEGSPTLFDGATDINGESLAGGLVQLCRRIQLNTHGQPTGWSATSIARMCRERLPLSQVICQIDDGAGDLILQDLLEHDLSAVAFYDLSHGAGISPDHWPSPEYIGDCDPETGDQQYSYHGYGGGLGPDNLESEIPRILEAAKGDGITRPGRIWIDMETKVRSFVDGRDVFDLDKARRCLEIAAPFIGKR